VTAVLDTNVSRDRHRPHIKDTMFLDEYRASGFVYACPRCGDESTVMKHRSGAEHRGDVHALECAP
jgi:hypothetical protein